MLLVALLWLLRAASMARAEDGYDLWLRYARVEDAALRAAYERALTTLVAGADSPTERVVVAELTRARAGLLGSPFTRADAVATVWDAGRRHARAFGDRCARWAGTRGSRRWALKAS